MSKQDIKNNNLSYRGFLRGNTLKLDKLFKKKFIINLTISLILYLLAIVLAYLSSLYIKKNFVAPPIVQDLMWNILPNLKIIWVSEIFIILTVIFTFLWALKKDKDYIPYLISLWALFQIIRAGMIVLTPLGFPNHYSGLIPTGEESVFAFGAFPSGHLAYPILAYLITKMRIFILFSILVILALLISRGHYSIDLIGTFLLSYPLYILAEKYIKKYFIEK
ncbi:MAG: hypothetical protein WC533_04150 [Candidatus Pacearchaeota archaeon]